MRQNRFARRIGLKLLKVVFTFVFSVLVLAIALKISLTLNESGFLQAPEYLRERADQESL